MPNPKVMLVGWDAADWRLIKPLMEAGRMPHVQRLLENGVMAQIATLHPPLSPMLWTSIATGKRPFKHGVLGFTEPTADGRAIQPVTNLSRKAKAVWNILQQNGLRSIVIGWWPSHPAEPIHGVMVSDHYHRAFGPLENGWPLRAGTVHPPELSGTLAELRIHPEELALEMMQEFIPDAANIDQEKDGRLLSMCKMLCECASIHSAATWLLDHQPWDFFAVYYDAIDHFSHGFMRYHPPKQPWITDQDFERYHRVVTKAYELHDRMLGTLLRKAGNDVRVVLMSDHGFHSDHLRPRAIPDIPAGPAIEHRDFGILVMSGEGFRKDELIHGASVLDIAPTLLTLYGLPMGKDMDGKVLTEAFETPPRVDRISSWEDVPGDDGRHPPDTRLDPVAAKEALDQLVALGYIEPLAETAELAVAQSVQELEYNLCEAYQDTARHAEAVEIARRLCRRNPDEQRFAVKRFVSCQALDLVDEMREIVADLDGRRRALYVEAVEKVQEFRELAKERFRRRAVAEGITPSAEEFEVALQDALSGLKRSGPPLPPQVGREPLFTAEEAKDCAKWKNLARYQPPVIDYLQAQVFTAEHRWFDALKCLGRVEQAHLVRPGLLLQTAELYGRLQQWEEAERTYLKALAIDSDNPYAHLGICRVALRKRDYRAAAQAALDCLQRLYQYPMAHFLLGVALMGAREYGRAAGALRVALALNPNFPQAHIRMAWLLKHKLKDANGAEEHLRRYRETRQKRRPAQPVSADLPAVDDTAAPAVPEPAKGQAELPPLGDDIVVVCGLPRSGTSLIMQMLAAGGVPVLTDSVRPADEDNPLGYFEFGPVKTPGGYQQWIGQAAGKAVKVVAPLISALPPGHNYRVILIERHLDEVLLSQARMIERRGAGGIANETAGRTERLKQEYRRRMKVVKAFLEARGDVQLLALQHSAVIQAPARAARSINLFCGGGSSEVAMAACVKADLHRQRIENVGSRPDISSNLENGDESRFGEA